MFFVAMFLSIFFYSPEMVTALSIAGRLDFNPLTDSLTGSDGKEFKLEAPFADELPSKGFDPGSDTYAAPREVSNSTGPSSEKIRFITKFIIFLLLVRMVQL